MSLLHWAFAGICHYSQIGATQSDDVSCGEARKCDSLNEFQGQSDGFRAKRKWCYRSDETSIGKYANPDPFIGIAENYLSQRSILSTVDDRFATGLRIRVAGDIVVDLQPHWWAITDTTQSDNVCSRINIWKKKTLAGHFNVMSASPVRSLDVYWLALKYKTLMRLANDVVSEHLAESKRRSSWS